MVLQHNLTDRREPPVYITWTVPTSTDVVPAGQYDLRLHVAATDETARIFTTARVSLPEPRSIDQLDEFMTASFNGRNVSVISIKIIEDQVMMTRDEYQTLVMLARRGANPNLGHTSELWIVVHGKKLAAIETRYGNGNG